MLHGSRVSTMRICRQHVSNPLPYTINQKIPPLSHPNHSRTGSKIKHFNRLHQKTGIAYEDMLFFDDESINREVTSLGVTFVDAQGGLSTEMMVSGLRAFQGQGR